MNWLRLHRRSAWIIGLTLIVPAVLYFNVLFNLLGMRQAYQSDIDSLEPRIARLRGLIAYEEQLRNAAAEVDGGVVNLVHPAVDDRATVAARLQKDVRQVLVDAGLSVTNSQVLPPREHDMFDYISVKVTVTGDLTGLDEALETFTGYMPIVIIESLDVYPRRASRRSADSDRQIITATMQLLSLRAVQ